MSQQNVERFRRIPEAWNRRDLEAYLELLDPEIEWFPGATRVEGGAYRGRQGIRQFWADIEATFDKLVPDFEESGTWATRQ